MSSTPPIQTPRELAETGKQDFAEQLKIGEAGLIILRKLLGLKLMLIVHPDNEIDSEFADRIEDLEEIDNILPGLLVKATKWDALDKKISSFYNENNKSSDGLGLIDIGEVTAAAFGYL